MAKTKSIPAWVVMCDGGVRCTRCGKAEAMPLPMPADAFGPWCQYVGALHKTCQDTGRRDPDAKSVDEWWKGHDTGISSRAIYRRMMGYPRTREAFGDCPADPDDFGRCYRLLLIAPEWRARIGEMSANGKQWARLAEHWDELTAMYEAIGWEASGRTSWNKAAAVKMYDRMKQLERPAPHSPQPTTIQGARNG